MATYDNTSNSVPNVIDHELLKKYTSAYIMFEIANHGVDPRETLDGTSMRITGDEGYKYNVIENWAEIKAQPGSYYDKIIRAFRNSNFVDYHQEISINEKLTVESKELLEEQLALLYTGDKDEEAFNNIVKLIGGRFDVLSFLFFLKSPENYLPVKSVLFDERFRILKIDSKLAGNCTCEKYLQYNTWIREIYNFLRDNLNSATTLIDAHSFLWILPGLKSYLDNESQAVEHIKFGKGIVLGFEKDMIIVQFGKQTRKFAKDSAFSRGLMKFIPGGFDIYGNKINIRPIDEETKRINSYEDDKLVAELREDEPEDRSFEYTEGAKERPSASIIKGHVSYPRDRHVASNALVHAHYLCEIDPMHPTFIRKNSGKPYTEPHHLIPMAFQDQFPVSLDREQNIVSLCSNCHNEIHYGRDAGKLIEKLFNDRRNALESIGVELTLGDLFEMYS